MDSRDKSEEGTRSRDDNRVLPTSMSSMASSILEEPDARQERFGLHLPTRDKNPITP